MKIEELNENLIGKRVKCVHGGCNRTGTIIGIVEDEYTKSAKIQLDEPVFFASGYGVQHVEWYESEFESWARKCDNWGNLKYTELI